MPAVARRLKRPTPRHRASNPRLPVYMALQPVSGTASRVTTRRKMDSFSPVWSGGLLPRLFTLTVCHTKCTAAVFLCYLELYPCEYLPVRKDGALRCPDFPLSSRTAAKPRCRLIRGKDTKIEFGNLKIWKCENKFSVCRRWSDVCIAGTAVLIFNHLRAPCTHPERGRGASQRRNSFQLSIDNDFSARSRTSSPSRGGGFGLPVPTDTRRYLLIPSLDYRRLCTSRGFGLPTSFGSRFFLIVNFQLSIVNSSGRPCPPRGRPAGCFATTEREISFLYRPLLVHSNLVSIFNFQFFEIVPCVGGHGGKAVGAFRHGADGFCERFAYPIDARGEVG